MVDKEEDKKIKERRSRIREAELEKEKKNLLFVIIHDIIFKIRQVETSSIHFYIRFNFYSLITVKISQ